MAIKRTAPLGIVSAAALTLVAQGSPARAQDAITIGILMPISGNFAPNGQQAVTGLKMYFDKVGNKAGGHPLTVIVEDTQGKPDVAVTKAASSWSATAPRFYRASFPRARRWPSTITPGRARCHWSCPATRARTRMTLPGPLLNPYLVRVSQNGRTVSAAAADFVYKTKGWHKVVTIGSDYAGGVDTNFEFARSFCQAGGQVIQAEWPPIGTADFGPYLTNLNRYANAVIVFEPGADGLKFGRQYLRNSASRARYR